MNRLARLLTLAMALSISLLQAGCWSSIEINERAIVTAAAFDKAETPGRIAITLQIINPSQVRQGGKDAVMLVSTTANTVFEASRLIRKTIPRKPFWGQIQVIIISEDLAQEGITEWLDFVDRDFEPNRRVWILISRGVLARQVLQAGFGFSPITATTLDGLVENAIISGRAVVANLNEVIMSLEAPSRATATGFIELAEQKATPPSQVDLDQKALLEGTAVFKEDKLVGYLGDPESRGVNWIRGKIGNTLVVVSGDSKPIGLEVVDVNSKVEPKIENGRPIMNVKVVVQAHVSDVRATELDLSNSQLTASVNRWLATSIEAEMKKAIKKAQDLHSDIFGFGSALCRAYPKEWKAVRDVWSDQVFPYIDVKFDVRAQVIHSGFLLKPAKER